MVTAAQFVEKVKIPLAEGWGYIYGTWGNYVWSSSLQEKFSQSSHKNWEMTKRYGAKWIGKTVTDCSGLLRRALYWLGEEIVHHARYQYTDYCKNKGKLVNGLREDGTPPLPGSAVFLQGTEAKIHHVGVYIGNDTVIEAKGTFYGVVTSKLNHWDHWGELKMVDYTDAAQLETEDLFPAVEPKEEAAAGTIFKAVVANPNRWLNVRSAGNSSAPIEFTVEKGSIVDVLNAEEPKWWQIRYGGRIGWAFAEYLGYLQPLVVEESPEATDDEPEPTETEGETVVYEQLLATVDKLSEVLNELKQVLDRVKEGAR